jgi:gamma-glutamyltranspeptidase / glutathione hydrolase
MRIFLVLLAALIMHRSYSQTYNPYHYQVQKTTTGRHGAVVSAHPLASAVGVDVMKRLHGNVVDAAIATQLALAVVYPAAGNIGGGGFMVAHFKDGKNVTIDYREKAPAGASRNMYLDKDGNVISSLSVDGHLASGVPGTIAGLFAAMPYASLPFNKLIQPAIDLAEHGFCISAREANALNANQAAFKKLNTRTNAFERKWKAGDTLVQHDLANTLKRIRDKGQAGFYEGETANLIVAEMQRGHGLITAEDLKSYQAQVRTPISFRYKNYDVVTMPPPSSGGVALQQMLSMSEPYPLARWGFHSVRAVQLMIEIERRVYADRAEYLGDPDFIKVPVSALTDETYLRGRMEDYDSTKAGISKNINAGVIHESNQTTHFSVMDADGNAISVTTTLNGGYGNKVVVGGAGFLLNNEMDDFSAKPGVPNMYGLVGKEANAIAPGKRMLSSMTPTIVLRDSVPYISTGTPGGSTIMTSVFQTLLNLLEFGLTPAQAVNSPKFHHQWLPDEVDVEKGFEPATIKALKAMGYNIVNSDPIGRVEVIRLTAPGKLEAVGDIRGDDSAAAW